MSPHSPHIHPPKIETFDIENLINIDPKGYTRAVDTYTRHEWGVYMERGADHPGFGYVQSWIFYERNIRATIFHFRAHMDLQQEFYLDIMHFDQQSPSLIRSTDLYLDVVCKTGGFTTLLDSDELAQACHEGVIDAQLTTTAIETSTELVGNLHAHNHDFRRVARDCWGIELVAKLPAEHIAQRSIPPLTAEQHANR